MELMAENVFVALFLTVILFVNGTPVLKSTSFAPSTFAIKPNTRESLSLPKCSKVEYFECSKFYNNAQMPNAFGEHYQLKSSEGLHEILSKQGITSRLVTSFLCGLYLPPCTSEIRGVSKTTALSVPCRSMCEQALRESSGSPTTSAFPWPVNCHALPMENCYTFDDVTNSLKFVKTSKKPNKPRDAVARFAPIEVELGEGLEEDLSSDDDDEFAVEVVSVTPGTSSGTPSRRYDIADLGDPSLFQGWVDVQGTGAANDYCRVIGKGKRRFLSCNLAGSTGQSHHHYVSKLGFDPGHSGTWFMRDMDGDNKDDYCRCVGRKSKSHVSCMKAGDRGFYGSSTQGGSEHTFRLRGSEYCVDRRVNQYFGE